MLNQAVSKIISSLKISKTEQDELNRLLARPEVKAVFDADENDKIAHRQSLIAELQSLPATEAKLRGQAAKETAQFKKRFEAAEKEYHEAMEALRIAQLAHHYAGYQDSLREMEVKRELIASACPRISEFRFEISNLIGRARSKCAYSVGKERNWLGSMQTVFFDNIPDVEAARTALDSALIKLGEMELAALTTIEVTKALTELSQSLRTPLSKLDMNSPTINPANGAVEQPRRDGERLVELEQPKAKH